ncbi:hypothetical protein Golomagni_06044 [Golovinomyces magnicellulatus]|nr:hypothetical protein Golomagni_06044 [Golovinomyces magnicellulatus]
MTNKMNELTIEILNPHSVDYDRKIKYNDTQLPAIKALQHIKTYLRSQLDVPLNRQPTLSKKYQNRNSGKCSTMKDEFKSFIKSAKNFLNAVEIKRRERKKLHTVGDFLREVNFRLLSTSTYTKKEKRLLSKKLSGIQKLWSSRKGNDSNRSFIEQQQTLYDKTKCFDTSFDDILIKNLEINDKLNELIDFFE